MNANRQSGGVAVLVKQNVVAEYDIKIVDRMIDGILALTFTHKNSAYTFLIISCYLPPDKSSWGQDTTTYFSHVLCIMYRFHDVDAVYMMGDINARIGSKLDYNEDIDENVPTRSTIDTVSNKHGEAFLEFLRDSKSCVINGRINIEHNNFTFVDPRRGSSVVDWVFVPHDTLINIHDFKIHLCKDLCNQLGFPGYKHSDHSVLELDIIPHIIHSDCDTEGHDTDEISSIDQTEDNIQGDTSECDRYYRRYSVIDVPDQFMSSELVRQAIVECIDIIEHTRAVQADVDNSYQEVCNIYYNEMDKWLTYKNINPSAKRRLRHSVKPFWNDELQNLWNDLCKTENEYLSKPQNSRERQRLRMAFKTIQANFDRVYSKEKRRFERQKRTDIERFNTEDHKSFWTEIQNLGPRKSTSIPMSVYKADGSITCDKGEVLGKWETDFNTLYNNSNDNNEFDTSFYQSILEKKQELELNLDENKFPELNCDISLLEVEKLIKKAKSGKAVGLEGIPNEVLKNALSTEILCKFFNKVFTLSMIPTIWRKGIIKPIPKGSMLDPKVPMQYRGISLLSTLYKIYSGVLNSRLITFLETHNIYADEQNGFRPGRSCTDHLYVLNTVIRHKFAKKESVFACFIDAEKAFDKIDRDLLFYKLLNIGVDGKMYNSIKNIYSQSFNSVSLNGLLTNWFTSDCGVKQGDTLSPTLFGIFVNDLISDVKQLDKGIQLGNEKVSILVYADDIVILANTEEDLQCMMNKIADWGKKWRVKFSGSKSNVVHFRKAGKERTSFNFTLGNLPIQIVEKYKYLGLVLHETLSYDVSATVLADAGGRALGAIINKYKKIGGLGYYTYTTMYNAGVCPILDYASEIWGYKSFPKIDTVQNRAIRAFLGVHTYAANAAINGDFGWTYSSVRRKVAMVRYWNKLQSMDEDRLTKRVLLWEKGVRTHGWANDVKCILDTCSLLEFYDQNQPVSTNLVWARLHDIECTQWKNSLSSFPKLRTYVNFKNEYSVEPYVQNIMNKKYRSVLAKLRCGILPLAIETGRWKSTPLEERVCVLCNDGSVEDEHHFAFLCNFYNAERMVFLREMEYLFPMFNEYNTNEKWKILMSKEVVSKFAKYLYNIFQKRQSIIFQ